VAGNRQAQLELLRIAPPSHSYTFPVLSLAFLALYCPFASEVVASSDSDIRQRIVDLDFKDEHTQLVEVFCLYFGTPISLLASVGDGPISLDSTRSAQPE
jgi:hypothetical protein